MKTPQQWFEDLGAGKMHWAKVSRLDIERIQEDAKHSAFRPTVGDTDYNPDLAEPSAWDKLHSYD